MPRLDKEFPSHNFEGSSFVWEHFKSNSVISIFGLPLLAADALLLPVRLALRRKESDSYDGRELDRLRAEQGLSGSEQYNDHERGRGKGKLPKARSRSVVYPGWSFPYEGFRDQRGGNPLHDANRYPVRPADDYGRRGGPHQQPSNDSEDSESDDDSDEESAGNDRSSKGLYFQQRPTTAPRESYMPPGQYSSHTEPRKNENTGNGNAQRPAEHVHFDKYPQPGVLSSRASSSARRSSRHDPSPLAHSGSCRGSGSAAGSSVSRSTVSARPSQPTPVPAAPPTKGLAPNDQPLHYIPGWGYEPIGQTVNAERQPTAAGSFYASAAAPSRISGSSRRSARSRGSHATARPEHATQGDHGNPAPNGPEHDPQAHAYQPVALEHEGRRLAPSGSSSSYAGSGSGSRVSGSGRNSPSKSSSRTLRPGEGDHIARGDSVGSTPRHGAPIPAHGPGPVNPPHQIPSPSVSSGYASPCASGSSGQSKLAHSSRHSSHHSSRHKSDHAPQQLLHTVAEQDEDQRTLGSYRSSGSFATKHTWAPPPSSIGTRLTELPSGRADSIGPWDSLSQREVGSDYSESVASSPLGHSERRRESMHSAYVSGRKSRSLSSGSRRSRSGSSVLGGGEERGEGGRSERKLGTSELSWHDRAD